MCHRLAYFYIQVKGTVVPVHAMKAYRGNRGKTPFILNLETTEVRGQISGTYSIPSKEASRPTQPPVRWISGLYPG